jgi:hypothetical protein
MMSKINRPRKTFDTLWHLELANSRLAVSLSKIVASAANKQSGEEHKGKTIVVVCIPNCGRKEDTHIG